MAKKTFSMSPPDPPTRLLPDPSWLHYDLYQRVRDALTAIPSHFRSETFIAGVMATDLHTLNSVLGATIEEQAAATLNAMRMVWDPDEKYALFSFVRQPQTFPDVLLRKAPDGDILLGIELKGWYLLSKEGEPSYRYVVTEAACAPPDLLVLVPWALSSVLSGRPVVFDPHVEVARYASQARNHHWRYVRNTKKSREIEIPSGIQPYPKKSDQIADKPEYDKGNNFGRLARSGIPDMDVYFKRMLRTSLCGVRVEYWLRFLKALGGDKTEDQIRDELAALARAMAEDGGAADPNRESLLTILVELRKLAGLPAEQD